MKFRTKQQQVSRLNGALIGWYINQKHGVQAYPRLIIVTNGKSWMHRWVDLFSRLSLWLFMWCLSIKHTKQVIFCTYRKKLIDMFWLGSPSPLTTQESLSVWRNSPLFKHKDVYFNHGHKVLSKWPQPSSFACLTSAEQIEWDLSSCWKWPNHPAREDASWFRWRKWWCWGEQMSWRFSFFCFSTYSCLQGGWYWDLPLSLSIVFIEAGSFAEPRTYHSR